MGTTRILNAKAKRKDGKFARAECRLRFQPQSGNDKFSNFHYEDLKRSVLGDVAGDKLYVNSGYVLHLKLWRYRSRFQ